MLYILSLFTVLILFGCRSDDSTNPPPSLSDNPSKIRGRVTGTNGFGKFTRVNSSIEDAKVTAAKVQSNGSLQAVSEDSVQTKTVIYAYLTFYSEVQALVGTILNTGGQPETHATAEILILINIQV